MIKPFGRMDFVRFVIFFFTVLCRYRCLWTIRTRGTICYIKQEKVTYNNYRFFKVYVSVGSHEHWLFSNDLVKFRSCPYVFLLKAVLFFWFYLVFCTNWNWTPWNSIIVLQVALNTNQSINLLCIWHYISKVRYIYMIKTFITLTISCYKTKGVYCHDCMNI